MTKSCTLCNIEYPATEEFFYYRKKEERFNSWFEEKRARKRIKFKRGCFLLVVWKILVGIPWIYYFLLQKVSPIAFWLDFALNPLIP